MSFQIGLPLASHPQGQSLLPPGSANGSDPGFNIYYLYLDFKEFEISLVPSKSRVYFYNSLALPNISPDVCFKSRHPKELAFRCRTPGCGVWRGTWTPHSLRGGLPQLSHSSVTLGQQPGMQCRRVSISTCLIVIPFCVSSCGKVFSASLQVILMNRWLLGKYL